MEIKSNVRYVISIKGTSLKTILSLLEHEVVEVSYFDAARRYMDIITSIEEQVKATNDEEAE